ncbi:MAG: FlgD immunoglobulin-like domain containing protein [bacterium]|nr:FlgD immunoglobulin-like domain containing protein [bacterium]
MRQQSVRMTLLTGLFLVQAGLGAQTLSVSFTTPLHGQHFTECSDIPVQADVQVTGGEVQNVQFFRNGLLMNTDTKAPYEFNWKDVPPGVYGLTAVVNGKQGGTASAGPVVISVGDGPDGNILANGEFSCSLWPWTFNIWEASARATFKLDTTTGLAAGSAAVIDVTVPGTANWQIQLQNPVALQSGRTYELGFMARATPARTIEVTLQENKEPYTVYFQQNVPVDQDNFFGPFEFVCEINDPAAFLRFNVGAQAGTFVLDQVELIDPTVTSVKSPDRGGRPAAFILGRNFPNPFNAGTVIEYSIAFPSEVRVEIVDMNGRRVRSLAGGSRTAGTHQIAWDGRNDAGEALPSGVYAYRIQAAAAGRTSSFSKKMLLLN